jgi:RHS repeat-associated protein
LSACTRDALGRIASQTETLDGASVEKAYAYDLRRHLVSVTTDGGASESCGLKRQPITTESFSRKGAKTPSRPETLCVFASWRENTPLFIAVSYDRDALHRVTAKRVNGAVTQGWIYKDGLAPVAETDASGAVVSFFVYGTSTFSPDYMVKDGTTYRLIRDFAGSVRLVVNADTGAIAQRLDYDSFGNILTDANPGFQPFGFKSGLYDSDTGLVHFGARWYDPATGRWISKDPILFAGGLNLYAFCGNDPVSGSDPSGLCEKKKDPWYKRWMFFADYSGAAGFGAGKGLWGGAGGTMAIDLFPSRGQESLGFFGHIDGGYYEAGVGVSHGPQFGLLLGAQEMADVSGLGGVLQLDGAWLGGVSIMVAVNPDFSVWSVGVGPSAGAEVSVKIGGTTYSNPEIPLRVSDEVWDKA